ncbi:branched-chain amino acid ABC transporter permease [Rhodoplanes sp. TEM]|uniref:Branched-chain amino acid ABC transporter permease n=1 Tax=Rhodoplanes tepidamans TaxID=200616 RepID=A0ABT5J4H5_RHOTP|nr:MULTISPECIES: branched-chain amino acid ABC transporter permease [Rhodoplanes]MDC7784526.1 branched-chain amino acid ABC transporter permease [Rhodoplanes tepidamans]MDC7984433.1 branched-chain amino acid ABC transporter permease [Rhodoplanes sp. TEM]MDQ0355754.1 branched-chain amino acid transport system permease protein [Rhodoplanes tepidamans]
MILELLANAISTGVLLGCIYAALALGLAVSFGLLHIPNIAHPVFVVTGAFAATVFNAMGFDPLLVSLPLALVFYGAGIAFFEFYSRIYEKRGESDTMQALTLFFGVSLVIETVLVMQFGADQRSTDVDYVGQSLTLGPVVMPYRLLIPALVAPVMVTALWLYLKYTYAGIAIRAVAHDERALSVSGIDPGWIKRHAFGIAAATAAISGAALVIVGPIDPFAGRMQIGRAFAVVILAGMGSIPGTLAAGILIGVTEALVGAFGSPSWAPAVAFTMLLATLAFKPSGLFGAAR